MGHTHIQNMTWRGMASGFLQHMNLPAMSHTRALSRRQLLALVCVISCCCGNVVAELPPAVFLADTQIRQILGETAVLECEVHAELQPVIRWTKSGREITSDR